MSRSERRSGLRVATDGAVTQTDADTEVAEADPVELEGLLGRMELCELVRVAAGIADALQRLHESGGLCSDLRPSRLRVSLASGAAFLGESKESVFSSTGETRRFGGLPYVAPERTGHSSSEVDSRADLYSLGVILYELATGQLPFAASEPLEWVHAHLAVRPIPPGEQRAMPAVLQQILLKLLEKEPERRYQTASGVAYDLRECSSRLEAHGAIASFPLGRRDVPCRLPRQLELIGRTHELGALEAAFERVRANGAPELVLVSGYSGIGKSELVRQFLSRHLPSDTLVVTGKFDDRESEAPYAPLMQPFRELCRWVLARPATELDEWRAELLQAIGGNAVAAAELLPELGRLIEVQTSETRLPADETRNRVHASFRRLFGVFARRKRLVLFLDDLQWADRASLELAENLLLDPDLGGVLFIGVHREESAATGHALLEAGVRLRAGGLPVHSVRLAPLGSREIERMVEGLLLGPTHATAELARVVERKTGGNPFFVRQFLAAAIEDKLLCFDPGRGGWSWDLPRVSAKVPTDNLADLLLQRLARLPAPTQHVLETLACLGTSTPPSLLAELSSVGSEELESALRTAVDAEVVTHTAQGYAFGHDRLQTAAYSCIPEAERARRHLTLGRALRERMDRGGSELLFEVVRQLNRAAFLITDEPERVRMAELNLEVARRSRTAAATATALLHVEQAFRLLPTDHWQSLPGLSFDLVLARAESEFMSGEHERAEAELAELAARTLDLERRSAVVCVQLSVYTASRRFSEAVDIGLGYLRAAGVPWRALDQVELDGAYARLRRALGNREIESLADAPPLDSAFARAIMEVCFGLISPAANTNRRLFALIMLHMATLSIEHGSCDLSIPAYANLSYVLGPVFGEHALGLEFGKLGGRLAEAGGSRFVASAGIAMGLVVAPRAVDAHAGCAWLVRARDAADQFGDVVYSVQSRHYLVVSLLARGAPLEETEREADRAIDHATRHRFHLLADRTRIVRSLVRGLREAGRAPGSLDDERLEETAYERALHDGPDRTFYWVRRLEARYHAGDFEAARAAARTARGLPPTPSTPHEITLWFFGALAEAACADRENPAEALELMADAARELEAGAGRCPASFADKVALVRAERARLTSRVVDAELAYEQAAELAQRHRLVHEEALAHELAARFYSAIGIRSVARAKCALARARYLEWGALAKVAQLDAALESTSGTEVVGYSAPLHDLLASLDGKVLISALQAVSSSLEPEQLIQALMTSAVRHAGAERGLLVLNPDEPRIRALATSQAGVIHVHSDDFPISGTSLPESVVRYVLRSGERVSTRDGMVPEPFRGDVYFERHAAPSLLCLPIMLRGKAVGAMYLENSLTRQSYGARGLAVLDLLASQAGISLENARLYAGLHQAQQRMARAEHVSRAGSFSWRPLTQELEFSEELSNIFGLDRPPTVALLRERVHPDDRPLFDDMVVDSDRYQGRTMDLRLAMPDGTIKHLAIIGSRIRADEFAGAVRDVTAAKQAEEALERTQSAMAEMAHLASLAEMSAAIAHEVNQPIAAIGMNVSTGLRRLTDDRVDVQGARAALERIQRDVQRAGAVVQRLRALFAKRECAKTGVDLNDAISEVVALVRNRIRSVRATLLLELSPELPAALGDRMQLQQVVMNLVNNGLDAMIETQEPRILTIRTALAGLGRLKCEVEDRGRGVTEPERWRIFDPFFTTKQHGMGIGLSVCKNIISSHGGELEVRAGENGVGSVFYFVLPCSQSG
jgi:predicted ATPase/signal transduction histidine kinase